MTLAAPVWEGRISPVFDVAGHLLLVDVDDGIETSRREKTVDSPTPHGWPSALSELGVRLLICGAISDELAAALARHGVRIIPWIRGEVDQVLQAYLAGELPDPRFVMPGIKWEPATT